MYRTVNTDYGTIHVQCVTFTCVSALEYWLLIQALFQGIECFPAFMCPLKDLVLAGELC